MRGQKDESPVGAWLSRFSGMLDEGKRFWRTKRAIDAGEPLYDWTAEQLTDKDYFGPWKLNGIKALFIGGIAGVAGNAIFFLMNVQHQPSFPIPGAAPELAAMLNRTWGWVKPFLIPILTTSIVFLIAAGSLHTSDSNQASGARARRAYFYFDGAFGGVSKFLLVLGFPILVELPQALEDTWVGVSLISLTVPAFFVQVYVTINKIPKRLFSANGYLNRARSFWQAAAPGAPPWKRFSVTYLVGGFPLSAVVSFGLILISWLLAVGLNSLKAWVS